MIKTLSSICGIMLVFASCNICFAVDNNNVCQNALDPGQSHSRGTLESDATSNYISLLRALSNKGSVLGSELLQQLVSSRSPVSPFDVLKLDLSAADDFAYRQAFKKLVQSGKLAWDVVRSELQKLAEEKSQATVVRKTAKEETNLVVREVGVIDSKLSTSNDIGINGYVDGPKSFLYLHDSPYIELKSAAQPFARSLGGPQESFLFNLEKMTAIPLAKSPGRAFRLADGRNVVSLRDRDKLGVYEADTGAPVFELLFDQIEGIQEKLKNDLKINSTVPAISISPNGRLLLNFLLWSKPHSFVSIDLVSKRVVTNSVIAEIADEGFHARFDFIVSRDGKRTYAFGSKSHRVAIFDLLDGKMVEAASIPLESKFEIGEFRADCFEASTGEIFIPFVFPNREKSYLYNATTHMLLPFANPEVGMKVQNVKMIELSPGELALVFDLGRSEQQTSTGRQLRYHQAIVHFDGRPTERFDWMSVGKEISWSQVVSFVANGKLYQVGSLSDQTVGLLDPVSHTIFPLSLTHGFTVLASFARPDGSVDLLIGNEQKKGMPLEIYRIAGDRPEKAARRR